MLLSVSAAAIAGAVPALVQALPGPPASATPIADVSRRLDLVVETRGAKVEPLVQSLRQQGVWVVRTVRWPELLLPASLRCWRLQRAAGRRRQHHRRLRAHRAAGIRGGSLERVWCSGQPCARTA